MSKKYKAIRFYLGYAEDQSIASICFEHFEGFDTISDAMENIRKVILTQIVTAESGKLCCAATKKAFPAASFCASCGGTMELEEKREDRICYESEKTWRDFFSATNDSAAFLVEELSAAGWDQSDGPANVTLMSTEQYFESYPDMNYDDDKDGGCSWLAFKREDS